jgi:sigma-B regulation protein RsbU (phosphoserine phosphatase)
VRLEVLIQGDEEMKFRIKSISVKMGLLYMFLAIVNMSFFTTMIYENQIDLITENGKYHVKERTEDFVASLKKLSGEMGGKKIFKLKNKDEVVKEVAGVIEKKLGRDDSLVIFNESGAVLYKSNPSLEVSKNDISNGITAITNLEYSGRQLYSTIDEKNYVMSFYIPYNLYLLGDSIMLMKIEMRDFQKRLWSLYLMILVILGILALFHIVFAVIFQRMLIRPIQALNEKSKELGQGNLNARVQLKRDDEIGDLGAAFNSMADSIKEKIISLQRHNDRMAMELNVASGVQQLIYPQIENDRNLNYAIYHRPFGPVTGDYYDIIKLGDSRTGVILVDVSGHGVPAALLTMVIKEIFNRMAPQKSDPAELFRSINTEIVNLLTKDDTSSGIYFTAIYVLIDQNKMLSFINAGHEQAVVVKKNLHKIGRLSASGGPVGISTEMNDQYLTATMSLEQGDKIILFTDGIIEARNAEGAQYGIENLLSSIRKEYAAGGEPLMRSVIGDFESFVGKTEMKDDATLIIIEVK